MEIAGNQDEQRSASSPSDKSSIGCEVSGQKLIAYDFNTGVTKLYKPL